MFLRQACLKNMKSRNEYKQKAVKFKAIESAAEAWARICLYNIKFKNTNQNSNQRKNMTNTNFYYDDIQYDEEIDRKLPEFDPAAENRIKLRLYDNQCKKPATNQKENYENKTK